MQERGLFRIMGAICVFALVIICGIEIYERKFLPPPKSVITLHSSEIQLPESFEEVLQGEELQISINTATNVELEMIPGIGEVLAQNILDYRTIHGDFQSIEDILQVKGIGEKTLEKIKKYILIE